MFGKAGAVLSGTGLVGKLLEWIWVEQRGKLHGARLVLILHH